MSKDPDVKIRIALDTSALPGQAKRAEAEIRGAMQGAASATDGLTTALGMAKGAMDILTKGFAIVGLFNQVVASVRLVMEWWQKLQEETIKAGQKVANQWKLARQEAEAAARMRAPHESLEKQIALNERLLEKQRARHAFEADMAQMQAEREGNRRGVQRAILDGQRARGEITSREHLEGVRRMEDAAREESQGQRMREATAARDEAQAQYDAQAAESRTAMQNLSDSLQAATRAGILGQGGEERRDYWEQLAQQWADANEQVMNGPDTSLLNNAYENAMAERDYARAVQRRASLRDEILPAAQYLGITTQKEVDGKMVDINLDEVVAKMLVAWEEKRARLGKDAETQSLEEEDARQRLAEAQARVAELERTQAEEDQGVLQRRAQEDATLAHRAEAAAGEAEAAAAEARAALTREEERAGVQAEKAGEESGLQELRRLLAEQLQLLRERASADQQPAVAALESLLERSAREPEVLAQIEAMMSSSAQLSVSDDQSRRYGNDLRLLGNSGLDNQAVLGILQLLERIAQQQGFVDDYAGRLDAMDKTEAAAAEEQRRQSVFDQEEAARRARQQAEEAAAAARRSSSASGAAPLEGLDGALGAGTEAMQEQGAVSEAAVAAMGAFSTTSTELAGAAAVHAAKIEALRQGQLSLQQQIANMNRTNIC